MYTSQLNKRAYFTKSDCQKTLTRNISFLIIVFLFNPLLGVLLSVSFALSGKETKLCMPLIIFCSLYMAAINSTKVPFSDEIAYLAMYNAVPQNGIIGTLFYLSPSESPHEVIYSFLVYFLYYITFGQQYLFIAVITFLIYIFLYVSLFRVSKEFHVPNYIIIAGVLSLSFFTQHFNLTAHLIRQMLATSIVFYAISYRNSSFLKFIFWNIIAFNIHNSLILMIGFSLIPQVRGYLSKRELFFVGGIVAAVALGFTFIAENILNNLAASGDAAATIGRAAKVAEETDGDVSQTIVYLVTIPMLFIGLLQIVYQRRYINPIYTNINVIWCIIVLMLSYATFLQSRFMYMVYYFIPFVLFFSFRPNTLKSKAFCILVSLAMILRFYITLNGSGYEFCSTFEALVYPYPLLLRF